MNRFLRLGGVEDLQVVWQDAERTLFRGKRRDAAGKAVTVLVELLASDYRSAAAALDRLAHEYGLKDALDADWAVRPVEMAREGARVTVMLEDPGGEPLENVLSEPMETGRFLRLAVAIASALGKVNRRGLVHKDVKPANIFVNCADGQARLMRFGVASRLVRERQAPDPPEIITGTLAYMAPEQTGRMNRSIDSRSDLYALGVTFYRMLTGVLPFTADDPMEWVHCHIARRPTPPAERSPAVPAVLSDIVMKLLAKPAEERYQTAAGLERDLRRGLVQWERNGRIDPFPLGERDIPDRLVIPEKLYGRSHEVEALLAAFDRVVSGGLPELVLVSGYSGVGKSSLVNELQRALISRRPRFASGKFDQLQREVPYATLAQAFQGLVRPLLGSHETDLARWREALCEALGANGKLIADLVPELNLIVGEQPALQELEPNQARARFQAVLRRFVQAFAKPQHPLTLFLDDLQWADAGTLDFLEDAFVRSELRNLLLIGAYRDNEVDAAHPLMRKLSAIRDAGGTIRDIVLEPLSRSHIQDLIADAVRATADEVAPLAQVIDAKTGGNPFFTRQFIEALAHEKLLGFDPASARWTWDIDSVRAKNYTDNVVDLMVEKVVRLPPKTQEALQALACFGLAANFATVAVLLERSESDVHAALWEALRAELIERLPNAYRFAHDRVQEAAYSLIPEPRRAEMHGRLGRLLLASTSREEREEAIFEIVNQLNRGAGLMRSQAERDELAELNLIAAKRARASAAYATALSYFAAGDALLGSEAWDDRYAQAFALRVGRAECEFLFGALADADARLAEVARHAADLPDLAAVTRLRIEILTGLGRSNESIAAGLDYLRRVGFAWASPSREADVRQEYEDLWRRLQERPIEELLDLPQATDPVARGTMDVLAAMEPAAAYSDLTLRLLIVGRMVNLAVEHGNGDASCLAFAWLGTILGRQFGDYRTGYRIGRAGIELVERLGLDRYKARVHMVFGSFVAFWTEPVRAGRAFIQRAFEVAQQTGDLTYAAYSCVNLVTNMLASGEPLEEAQREAEIGLDFARKARFDLAVDFISMQLQFIRTLRGLTPLFGGFNDATFDEKRFEERFGQDPRLVSVAYQYWGRKLQALVLAGENTAAVQAAARAEKLQWSALGFLLPEHSFYAPLAEAALLSASAPSVRVGRLEPMKAHHRQLCAWAAECSQNFDALAALVGAEIARLEDRVIDAMGLYEQAVRLAREYGFAHREALANELAGRFYAARGLRTASRAYMREARAAYARWGADGKVRQLDSIDPDLRPQAQPPSGATSTMGAPVEQLDLATVIKVSQAASGEIVFERLIETLMRTAIEQAGAERGVLALTQAGALRVAAEARTVNDQVLVDLRDDQLSPQRLPQSLVLHAQRSLESVLIDDAASSAFASDPYFQDGKIRSALGLPLLNQGKLIGVLYLENNLAPRVFSPSRIAVLRLLASQAAVSLENSRLYRDLGEREARIRRFVDANIVGIFIWRRIEAARPEDNDTVFLDVNDEFLRIIGYERDELLSGRVRRRDLTPPEWQERSLQGIDELKTDRSLQPYEKEYLRKDGSRVPVLIGAAAFEDKDGREGLAFVLDLSERKRAEAEARENERRLRDIETELSHANRLESLGQLTASIAHEVNQPIASALTNAQAGLRWLRLDPPDLDEARQAFERIARDAQRAGAVVHSIRNLVKKSARRDDLVEINAAVREVVGLVASETAKNEVTVRTSFLQPLSLTRGDRVELQQVLLNLVLNAVEAMSSAADGVRNLEIATDAMEGEILVSVRDSGPGLAPAIQENLFKAFHTTKPNGLGLGLSICRSIIEAHGGRLWSSANAPRGTVFQFTLPPAADSVAAQPSRAPMRS